MTTEGFCMTRVAGRARRLFKAKPRAFPKSLLRARRPRLCRCKGCEMHEGLRWLTCTGSCALRSRECASTRAKAGSMKPELFLRRGLCESLLREPGPTYSLGSFERTAECAGFVHCSHACYARDNTPSLFALRVRCSAHRLLSIRRRLCDQPCATPSTWTHSCV